MNTKKIRPDEIADLKVSALPTRPTSDFSYGGEAYSSAELKAAFDLLPLYIIARLNQLIDDIESLGEGSLASSVPTGIAEGHTLTNFFEDIKAGNLANYIKIDGEALPSIIAELKGGNK